MSDKIPEAKIEQEVFQYFELKRKMHRHEEEIIKLDHECGIIQDRFYGSKDYAEAVLAFLAIKEEEYAHLYEHAFHDLVVQLKDYVASIDRKGDSPDGGLADLDTELDDPL